MKPTDFAAHLGHYLSQYLPGQQGASPNTVKAYRDAFKLFLKYCRDDRKIPPDALRLDDIHVELATSFLEHLKNVRHSGESTVNHRLAALHAFFQYLQVEEPARIAQCQRILAIPLKRIPRPPVSYLSKDDLSTILQRPSLSTRNGRRDAVLLSVLYDLGARVQEVIDLSVEDVRLEAPAQVKVVGKGRKVRILPLMERTVRNLKAYLDERGLLRPERRMQPLFQNRRGARLSRSGVRYILEKYVAKARDLRDLPPRISPHTLRHTKAMHLLQSGNPLTIIRDILGHSDIKTTDIYAHADLEMRRKALEKAEGPTNTPEVPTWHQNPELLDWLRSLQGHPTASYAQPRSLENEKGQVLK